MFCLRKLSHIIATLLSHFWLRYAKQLSQLTSISPLRACSTLGNYRCAH